MAITIFPETLELGIEDEAPRGFNSPINLQIETVEFPFEEDPAGTLQVVGSVSGLFPPPALPALGRWVLEVRDLNGGFYAALVNANPGVDTWTIGSLRWELNGIGGGSVSGPILDPGLGFLFDAQGKVIDGRELQITRDDLPAGPLAVLVPSVRANPRTVEIEGFGVLFHMTKKYVGRNNLAPELIENGSFDSDYSDWTIGVPGPDIVSWQPSGASFPGPGSVVLQESTAGNNYIYQNVPVPSLPFATFIWLDGWIWVDSAVDVRDLATSGRALWTVHSVGGTVVWQQGVSPNWRQAGEWVKLSTKIFIPANQTSTMQVRLYAPKGIVRYSHISARREERLNCEGDPGTIITCLVAHAQDVGLNKTFVNVGVDNSRGSGTVQLVRRYKYAEAANIASAMQEMVSQQGGVDFLVETPATNDRTVFTMSRLGYDPGPDKVSLLWGDNLTDWVYVWNPAKRADRGRVQGRGSGDEVTEAFYDDPDSELGWEFVRRTTIEGTPQPDAQAQGLGSTYKRPTTVQATVRRTPTFDVAFNLHPSAGGLLPGRLVEVNISHGPIEVAEDFKVLSVEFTPEREIAVLQLVAVSTLVEE